MNNEIMEANRMEQVQTTYEPYAEVCDSPSQMHNDNDSFGGDSYAAYSVSEPSLYILNAKRFLLKVINSFKVPAGNSSHVRKVAIGTLISCLTIKYKLR